MSLIDRLRADAAKPVATVVIPPSAWSTDYAARERADVCVGIRLPADRDIQIARAEAARQAWDLHPKPEDLDNRVDAFNDACMRWVLARALVDPNDAAKPWMEMAEDRLGYAFHTAGLSLLWEAFEAAQAAAALGKLEVKLG